MRTITHQLAVQQLFFEIPVVTGRSGLATLLLGCRGVGLLNGRVGGLGAFALRRGGAKDFFGASVLLKVGDATENTPKQVPDRYSSLVISLSNMTCLPPKVASLPSSKIPSGSSFPEVNLSAEN